MKLYRKKLNSVEELRRECLRLNYQKQQLKTEDLVPKLGFGGGREERKSRNAGILEMGLSLINAKGPLQIALAVAGPIMGMIGKRKKKAVTNSGPGKLLGNLARELVIGYLSGKGIQLAMRGIKWYLKKRREKKALQKAAALLAKT